MSKLKTFIYLTLMMFVLVAQRSAILAQKLPKVQTLGVRAPANIKIDGKLTEWNNKFQAYNSINRIYYTIANDNENLYFAAQTNDALTDKKIFKGGLTFTVIRDAKTANKIAITYPVISMKRIAEMERGEMGNVVIRHSLTIRSRRHIKRYT